MKETILAIASVLAVTLIICLVIYFCFFNTEEPELPSELTLSDYEPTESTTEPVTTEEPTTEPTTAEPTTESTIPEPEVIDSGMNFIVDGHPLSTYVTDEDETILAVATEYLEALGLDEEGARHSSEKELLIFADDSASLQVNESVYDIVYQDTLYLPVYAFAEEFGYPTWVDEEFGDIYITPSAKSFDVPQDVNVPVLMYHAVSDNYWGYSELFVSPSSVEKQLQYLLDNGYDPIWFEDLAYLEDYDKPVILTFDDGYDDNYTDLFPLLQKYNVKATIFIIGQDVNGDHHKMNQEQMKEIAASGLVSFQSHSYSHGDMGSMSEETLEYEIGEAQKVITRITGKVPHVLCYPEGKFSSRTIEVAQRLGLNFGLKMNGGLYNTSIDDDFKISRYYIARSTDINTFSYYISSAG